MDLGNRCRKLPGIGRTWKFSSFCGSFLSISIHARLWWLGGWHSNGRHASRSADHTRGRRVWRPSLCARYPPRIETRTSLPGPNHSNSQFQFAGSPGIAAKPRNKAAKAQTKRVLTQSKRALTQTKRVLIQSKRVLTQTKRVLTQTKRVLTQTKRVLTQTKRVLTQTKRVLTQSKRVLTQIKRVLTQTKRVLTQSKRVLTQIKRVLTQIKRVLTQTNRVLTRIFRASPGPGGGGQLCDLWIDQTTGYITPLWHGNQRHAPQAFPVLCRSREKNRFPIRFLVVHGWLRGSTD